MSDLPFSAGSRLVAYLRDSGGRDQNLSIPQQQESIGRWCRDNGYILSRLFMDAARSGTSLAGRDGFLEMVAYLESNAPEAGVVIWEYSRIARQFDDFQYYITYLRRKGYAVYSITDHIPDTLDGRLFESITAWKTAKYSEDLSKNIKRGQRFIAAVYHAKPGGKPPLGYLYSPAEIGRRRDGSPHLVNRLVPDPQVAPLVKLAFEMRANGATYREIHEATHLHNWITIYNRTLCRRIYTGVFDYGGMEIPDFCEPIVDQATWQAAQEVNRQHMERYGCSHPRVLRSRFILTGLLRCSLCGNFMYGWISRQKYKSYDYYRCKNHEGGRYNCGAPYIPKGELEARVLTAMQQRILEPVVLNDIYEEVCSQIASRGDEKDTALERARHDLADLEVSIGRIISAIKEHGHSAALLAELGDLEGHQGELREQIAGLEVDSSRQDIKIDMITVVENARIALDREDDRGKAIVLRGFISEIRAQRVNKKIEGEIEYHLPTQGNGKKFIAAL
jgi:site-specific DNA recombinase